MWNVHVLRTFIVLALVRSRYGWFAGADCPTLPGVVWQEESGDRCFILHENPVSWLDAENTCRERGGHLVTIPTDVTTTLLSQALTDNNVQETWIGITSQYNNWTWTDNTPLASDLPWNQRPPRQVDNCAAIIPSGGAYTLSKRQCSDWAEVLCETSINNPNCTQNQKKKEIGIDCYFQHVQPYGWFEAQQYCKEQGATLALLDTFVEYSRVVDSFDSLIPSLGLWVGLSNVRWFWSTEEPVNQFNWHQQYPAQGSCVVLKDFSGSYFWASNDCADNRSFVCEYGDNTSPIPPLDDSWTPGPTQPPTLPPSTQSTRSSSPATTTTPTTPKTPAKSHKEMATPGGQVSTTLHPDQILNDETGGGGGGTNTGVLVGIILAVIFILVLVGLILFCFFYYRRGKRSARKYKANTQMNNGHGNNRGREPRGPHNYYNDGFDDEEGLSAEQKRQLRQEKMEQKRNNLFESFVTSETHVDTSVPPPKKKKIYKAAVYDDDSPPIGHDYVQRQNALEAQANGQLKKTPNGEANKLPASGQAAASNSRFSERPVDVDNTPSAQNNNRSSEPDGNVQRDEEPEQPVKKANNEDLFSSITHNYRKGSFKGSPGGLHGESVQAPTEDNTDKEKQRDDLNETLNSSNASLHSLQSRNNIDPLNESSASRQKDKRSKKKSNHSRDDSFTKPLVDNEVEAEDSNPPRADSDSDEEEGDRSNRAHGELARRGSHSRDSGRGRERDRERSRTRDSSKPRDSSRTRDGSRTRDSSRTRDNSRTRDDKSDSHTKERHKKPDDFPLPTGKLEPIPKLDLAADAGDESPPKLASLSKLGALPKLEPIPKLEITARSEKDELGSTTRSAFDGEDTRRKFDELLNPFKKDVAGKYEVDADKVKEKERKHKHKSHHHDKEHRHHRHRDEDDEKHKDHHRDDKDKHKDDRHRDRHHHREDKDKERHRHRDEKDRDCHHRKDDNDSDRHHHHKDDKAHHHHHRLRDEEKDRERRHHSRDDKDRKHKRDTEHKESKSRDDKSDDVNREKEDRRHRHGSHGDDRRDSNRSHSTGGESDRKEGHGSVVGTPKSSHRKRRGSVSGQRERKSSVSGASSNDHKKDEKQEPEDSASDHSVLNETVILSDKAPKKDSESERAGTKERPSSGKSRDRPSSATKRSERGRPSSAGRSRARSSSASRASERESSRDRKSNRENKSRDRSLDRALGKTWTADSDAATEKKEKSGWTGDLIKDYAFALEKSLEEPALSKRDSGRKPNSGRAAEDMVLEELVTPAASIDFLGPPPPVPARPDVININPAGPNKSNNIRLDLGLEHGESIEI